LPSLSFLLGAPDMDLAPHHHYLHRGYIGFVVAAVVVVAVL
jgi:hypothetical protein